MTSPVDRRSSIRRPIHHDANVSIGSNHFMPCIIADYCQEGMFVKFDPNIVENIENHVLETLELSFRDANAAEHRIEAELVHAMPGAVGIRFKRANTLAIRALNEMNQVGQSVSSKEAQKIIDECILCIQESTRPYLKDLMSVIVEELRQFSVKASSDQIANKIMAASEAVEKESNSVLSNFMLGVKDPLGVFRQHLENSNKMNDSLSVVDKGEFEDWLMTRVLITKAETNFRTELLPLKVRLDTLGIGKKEHHQSVFGPALLVSAFHASISNLGFDASTEKLVLKSFEREVLEKIEFLYKELNQVLIKHEVLPDLNLAKAVKAQSKYRAAVKANKEAEAVDKQLHEGKQTDLSTDNNTTSKGISPTTGSSSAAGTIARLGGGSGAADVGSASFTQAPFSVDQSASNPNAGQAGGETAKDFSQNQAQAQSALDNVVGLMRSLRTKAATQEQTLSSEGTIASTDNSGEVASAAEVVSEQEMSEGLEALQAISHQVSLEDHIPLMSRIQENLEQSSENKTLDDSQKVAIDVVDRFFYSMRNNPRISSEAKQHLLKLEVPVLKVLLKDERFFEDHSSSVRAVMNRIAQLGAKGTALSASSKRKVSELVQKIVDQFEQDTEIFDYVLSELDTLVSRQNNIYVKNVERVAAAAEGVHKVEEAKAAVTEALNLRFENKRVPTAVKILVDQGWKDLLTQTHVKFGQESEQWHSYLSVLDRLIAFGENPDIPVDTKRILPIIQEGLKEALGSTEAPNTVRQALKQLIISAPRRTHSMVKGEAYRGPETEDQLIKRNLSKSQILKPWIVKAKSSELGAWFKLVKEGKDDQFIRLVWIAQGYSKFVFVNHQGMKVIELGLLKFSEHLKDQTIKPDWDYEQPLVNQSLDDMVKDVYDKLAFEASHDKGSGLIKRSEFCRQVKIQMRTGKRTAKCVLLYIRFENDAGEPQPLEPELAKDMAASLEDLVSDSILGRIDESDFVVFVVLPDHEISLDQLRPALLKKYADSGDIQSLRIGESQAHLGFNNPESMIQHAKDALGLDKSIIDDGDALSVPVVDEAAEPLVETPVANDASSEPEFADLDLAIWLQEAKYLSERALESGTNKKHFNHINLICRDNQTSDVYEPVSASDMKQLDLWWLSKLEILACENSPLFEDYEFVRLSLSAHALEDEEFIENLKGLADAEILPASLIVFDIYEGSAIQDVQAVGATMRRLMGCGYRFCLDHFGSERSPFAFLKSLPFFMINIDESFIQSINEEEGADVAADSIAEIAHYLGKKVLATSVDSAICAQKMKRLKVDYIQGSTVANAKAMD